MIEITRSEGQEIRIGDNILVQVKEIDGTDRVRLAIDAPHDVRIRRHEVWDRMRAEELRIVDCDHED